MIFYSNPAGTVTDRLCTFKMQTIFAVLKYKWQKLPTLIILFFYYNIFKQFCQEGNNFYFLKPIDIFKKICYNVNTKGSYFFE
jgi:hypothetical protein